MARYLSSCVVLGVALALIAAMACAQTPADAVADAVANSGVFPAGTTVVNVFVDGSSAFVELSAEAVPFGLGDGQVDDMCKAIMDALDSFGISALEVTVAGKPLWQYLPAASVPDEGGDIGTQSVGAPPSPGVNAEIGISSIGGGGGEGSGLPVLTGELAGKNVGLCPSHGAYFDGRSQYYFWRPSMRTLCGPNPSPPRPPGWTGSVYQPSNYYYWTRQFQWGSYYEDYRTPQEIRFLRSYLETSGANVVVGRNLDTEAGDFDYNAYGYPNCSFPLPKWVTAAKYHLQDIGAPAAVWNEPSLSLETDKDLRARPYWTNYNMLGWWHYPLTTAEKTAIQNNTSLWQNWIQIALHTNAAGSGTARGTETYRYTSLYPWLQTKATQLATAFNNGMINAIKYEYDGFWANDQYSKTMAPVPVEWPSGTYRGYRHQGASTPSSTDGWQNRGVKSSNFGEIRNAVMPAILTELLFHDDWKFYPDHVFSLDQIFQATVAWGMYEGICNYWSITPKPRMASTLQSVTFPTGFVGPSAAINGTVVMQNNGMVWCWGNKTVTENWPISLYIPYTVWKLQATASDQFVPGTKLEIDAAAPIYPNQTATFNIALTAPATTGTYTTEWQMLKDDAFGNSFGPAASAQIQVDADPPVVVTPIAGDYQYGAFTVLFSATDELSGVASVVGNVDGVPVTDGQVIYPALGSHTLTVVATDNVGNTITQSASFNIVNTVGKTTAGGWIELANKKATSGFVSEYIEGASAPSGNVTYQDHDYSMTVNSTNLIAMGIVGNHAWILGNCTIEGEPGHWFRIDVIDNGEPGDTDVFNILLDTGYSQGGTLGGGNVTIH